MADPQVKIKFTTDTSELKSSMDQATSDASSKVKGLSDDVEKESKKMEDNLDKVADSAKDVGNAADQAADGVKGLENQVAKSSSNMEKNLDQVAKKMSSMQMFTMGARGAQMGFGLAGEVASALGADQTAAAMDLAGNMAGGGMRGAAVGMQVAGPWGAVIGGLAGAGKELLAAGKDLKEAAKGREAAAQSRIEDRQKEKEHQDFVDRWTEKAKNMAYEAYGDEHAGGTEEGKAALDAELRNQQKYLDQVTAKRNEILASDEYGTATEKEAALEVVEREIQNASEQLQIFSSIAAQAAAMDERLLASDNKAAEAAQASIDARKKEAEAIRRRVEEEERRTAEAAAKKQAKEEEATRRSQEKDLKGQQKEAEAALSDTQKELEGVGRTTVGVTDDLTRIGGGAGYASYNNSVGDNVKTISNSLKQLIQIQQSGIDRITTALEDLNIEGTGTWGG